jgi:sugar phosphate isomerase/epimerase
VKLAVSNIGWEPREDDAVAAVLRREGVNGIEIAPTKWRSDPLDATATEVAEYRRSWEDRGLPIVAMQSLLFGKPELQLFAGAGPRRAMLDYLKRMLDLGAALGATAAVFGSPSNRRRGDMAVASANDVLVDFLRQLAPHANQSGVAFCLEPVPERYGCDFINRPDEALAVVKTVNARGIKVNADLGAMTFAGMSPSDVLRDADGFAGHFHASELDFAPLADRAVHDAAAAALVASGYDRWVSVEVKAVGPGKNVAAVERSARLARGAY